MLHRKLLDDTATAAGAGDGLPKATRLVMLGAGMFMNNEPFTGTGQTDVAREVVVTANLGGKVN